MQQSAPDAAPPRLIWIDNLRAFLIFCVVLGHLYEAAPFPGSHFLYTLLYLFHMPALAFLSGLCSSGRLRPGRLAAAYLYPYFVFQTLYLLAAWLLPGPPPAIQYYTPYWLLWYLPALAAWRWAAGLLQNASPRLRAAALAAAVALALAAGYAGFISYFLSLSRILTLFPYFLAGFFLRGLAARLADPPTPQPRRAALAALAAVLAAAVALAVFLLAPRIDPRWLYRAYPYRAAGYSLPLRLLLELAAAVLVAALCLLAPRRRVPLLSAAGANTLPVYLLHGFVVLALKSLPAARLPWPALWSFAAALLMVWGFSARPVARLLAPLVRWPFGRAKAAAGRPRGG